MRFGKDSYTDSQLSPLVKSGFFVVLIFLALILSVVAREGKKSSVNQLISDSVNQTAGSTAKKLVVSEEEAVVALVKNSSPAVLSVVDKRRLKGPIFSAVSDYAVGTAF